jgi:hypothetical protein
MRQLKDAERIRLTSLVNSDDWKLATEFMEAALADILEALKNTSPDSDDAVIANRHRVYVAAEMFYRTYINNLLRRVKLDSADILPDATAELFK